MIHKLAFVHPGAQIGENCTIGPFAYVGEDVIIGDNTEIMPNATVLDGARIGSHCKIFPGAVISAIPQDLKYKGENTTVEIGDHTTIRECVTINRGTTDKFTTRVGNNCLLMAYVHIAHDTFVGNHCIIANSANIAGHVIIEDHVTLEGVVAVQQFIRIGAYAFVAGGSLVRKNIPPFVKAAREPVSYVGVNTIGLRRRGMDEEAIQEVENIYRIIFVQNANLAKGLELVEMNIADSPLRQNILSFIKDSTKGVIKGIAS